MMVMDLLMITVCCCISVVNVDLLPTWCTMTVHYILCVLFIIIEKVVLISHCILFVASYINMNNFKIY